MSNRKVYRIKLTDEERETFTQVAKGKRGKLDIAAWKVQRANAMLKCDESEQRSTHSRREVKFSMTMSRMYRTSRFRSRL